MENQEKRDDKRPKIIVQSENIRERGAAMVIDTSDVSGKICEIKVWKNGRESPEKNKAGLTVDDT